VVEAETVDGQQSQNMNQVAEQDTDSARQSFQLLADRTVALQESNLRLTQSFFQSFVEQLHNQAQGALDMTQNLQEQSQRQQEAFAALSQEANNAYSNFLNSALSFYQESLRVAAQAAKRSPEHGKREVGPPKVDSTPLVERHKEKTWPRYPLFDSGDPTFAERVDEELAGFGGR
jgi:hypothetical protein